MGASMDHGRGQFYLSREPLPTASRGGKESQLIRLLIYQMIEFLITH